MKVTDFAVQFGLNVKIRHASEDPWLVYFLVRSGEIVYIGKSSDSGFKARLLVHKQDKEFDGYFVIDEIPSENIALDVEKGLISLIRPECNKMQKRICVKSINKMLKYMNAQPFEIPATSSVSETDIYKKIRIDGFSGALSVGQIKSKIKQYKWKLSNNIGKRETNLENIKKLEKSIGVQD